MRVTIVGAYGYGNFGDELMLDGVLAGIRRTMPEARVTVISGDSAQTARAHGVNSIERGGGPVARLKRYWELVRSDLFVVGGGNIRDHQTKDPRPSQPNSLAAWLGQVLLAHDIGVPTMCYGISIGHVLTPEGGAALKACLDRVDAITVRDPASAARIAELGVKRKVTVAADAAFSVIPRVQRTGPRRGMVLCLRHWYEKGNYVEDPKAFSDMLDEIANYCDDFFERHQEPVVLVPFKSTVADDDSDTAIHEELLSRMRHREGAELIELVPDLDQAVNILASARLVVGMRLHSIVLATALGTPWVSIDYDPKVRGFAEYAGEGRFSLEVGEVTSPRLSELETVALGDSAVSNSLNSVSDQFRILEQKNGDIARSVIQGRTVVSAPSKVILRTVRLLRLRLGRHRTGDTRESN